MDLPSLTLLLFAALTALALALLLSALGLGRRLARRVSARRSVAERPPPLIPGRLMWGRAAEDAGRSGLEATFERLVGEARLPWGPLEVALFAVALGVLSGGGLLLWADDPLIGLAGAVGGMLLALPLLRHRRSRVIWSIRQQWPEVLELLARAVRAGRSLDQAFELVGQEAPDAWGAPFRTCARQMEAGLSVQAAVAALRRRTHLPEAQELATVLTVHRQTGGNLSLMLERLAANARDRLDFQRQVRSATAGAHFATSLIVLMLVLGSLFLFVFEADSSRQFLGRAEGLAITATALALATLGLWWIGTILRVDY